MKKVAIVTGGSSGIGKAAAIKFLKEDYNVVIAGRNEKRGKLVAEEISTSTSKCIYIKTNVKHEKDVISLIKKTIEIFGRLDTYVNNAGISGKQEGFLDNTTEKTFRDILDTNLMGTYHGIKFAIQHMITDGGGSIVNVTSIAGLNGVPSTSLYTASKHAIIGLTKVAATEYANKGIRVNALAPGAVKTAILDGPLQAGIFTEEILADMHPMKRLGTVEDMANGIFYLASEQSTFMTGSILPIDGGYTAL